MGIDRNGRRDSYERVLANTRLELWMVVWQDAHTHTILKRWHPCDLFVCLQPPFQNVSCCQKCLDPYTQQILRMKSVFQTRLPSMEDRFLRLHSYRKSEPSIHHRPFYLT